MRKCPVCEQYSESMLCDNCSFDGSRDYEHNPTLQKLSAKIDSISHFRKTTAKEQKAKQKAAVKEEKAQRKAAAKAEKTQQKVTAKEENAQQYLTDQETQPQQTTQKTKKKMSKGLRITLIVLSAILIISAIGKIFSAVLLARSVHFDNYKITMGTQDYWTGLQFDTAQMNNEVIATVTFKINQEYIKTYRTPAISLISADGNITLEGNRIVDPADLSKYIYRFTIDENVPDGKYICTVDQLSEFGILPASRAVATLYVGQ